MLDCFIISNLFNIRASLNNSHFFLCELYVCRRRRFPTLGKEVRKIKTARKISFVSLSPKFRFSCLLSSLWFCSSLWYSTSFRTFLYTYVEFVQNLKMCYEIWFWEEEGGHLDYHYCSFLCFYMNYGLLRKCHIWKDGEFLAISRQTISDSPFKTYFFGYLDNSQKQKKTKVDQEMNPSAKQNFEEISVKETPKGRS